MTQEKIDKLLPYFALKYARENNPEKYGSATLDTFPQMIKDSQGDIDEIAKAAAALTEQQWEELDAEYDNAAKVVSAKKGAKLEHLTKLKAGKKIVKKCKCGCDMIDTKEEGGKIVSTCSCKCNGGKAKKTPKAVDGKKLEYLQKIKK